MKEQVNLRDYQLLRRLRKIRVLIIHPDDLDRKVLLDHFKRIGCQTDAVWPAPEKLEQGIDAVLFLLDTLEAKISLNWMSTDQDLANIAIISYETPDILEQLARLHVHGVISKPIRIFGVLAALTTAIGVAKHEKRLHQRIRTLDETLKSRRKIEQAVAILTKIRGISEEQAYKKLRDKSMKDKKSIATLAEAIIASSSLWD